MGDSMGSTVEFLHHETIRRVYGRIDNLDQSKGLFTDDTALRLVLYNVIIEKGRRITAYDLAEHWKRNVGPGDRYWITETFISALLHLSQSPREAGFSNIPADDAAMMIDPIGVVNCGNPRNAAVDAYDVGSICQSGPELEAAMAVAAAVAEAFRHDATPETVLESACRYSSPGMRRRIEETAKTAQLHGAPSDLYRSFYETIAIDDGSSEIVKAWRAEELKRRKMKLEDVSLGVSALEAVPVALAFFALSRGDPFETITWCVNYGRDCDTIAGIGGAIAGALSSVSSIQRDFIEKINSANNVSLQSIARGMIGPIINTIKEEEESTGEVRELLSKIVE